MTKTLRHTAQRVEVFYLRDALVHHEFDDYGNHRLAVNTSQAAINSAWKPYRAFTKITVKEGNNKDRTFVGCTDYWINEFPPVWEMIKPTGAGG